MKKGRASLGRIYGVSNIGGHERSGINKMIKAFNEDNSYFAGCVDQYATNAAYLLTQLNGKGVGYVSLGLVGSRVKQTWICDDCNQTFDRQANLDAHFAATRASVNSSPRNYEGVPLCIRMINDYTCAKCFHLEPKIFPRTETRVRHERRCDPEKKKRQYNFRNISPAHTSQKDVLCGKCNYIVKTAGNQMAIHQQSKTCRHNKEIWDTVQNNNMKGTKVEARVLKHLWNIRGRFFLYSK
jgi:hypothetical protein